MKPPLIKLSGIVVVIVSLGLLYWQVNAPGRIRKQCKLNLKSVGLALHAYHASNGSFPSAYSQSQPPHSWRVALLPWLDQEQLFDSYDRQSAWDTQANRLLLTQRPADYHCPEVTDPTYSSYQAVLGIQTAWPFDSPSRIIDFTDGTANTAMVVDLHEFATEWTRPADPRFDDVMAAIPRVQQHSGTSNMLFADGSVRLVSNKIDPSVTRMILTPSGGRSLADNRAALEHSVAPSDTFREPADASTLPATKLWPTPDVPLTQGTTVVYCPTLALGWKEYARLQPQVALTDLGRQLQVSLFSNKDIGSSAMQLDVLAVAEGGPRIVCKLKKHLAFAAYFDSFSLPLTFLNDSGEHKVKSFGVTSHWTDWRFALAQVRVHSFRSPDDFVISIDNLTGEDLILAKIPQPESLQTGISEIESRISDSRVPPNARQVVAEEDFVVPVLELSLSADFKDKLNHPDQPVGMRLLNARQEVQFRLDERGATVQSESELIGENGAYEYEPGTRTFIFDKPFCVMLRESASRQPYFAAWIGNADLMVPRAGKN
ncbi:MAG: DUF1559 domain-containing protein [Planctomycetota bacterium]|nr:DUF1559 domain-containing protein [Planctomycetota bacterium]